MVNFFRSCITNSLRTKCQILDFCYYYDAWNKECLQANMNQCIIDVVKDIPKCLIGTYHNTIFI